MRFVLQSSTMKYRRRMVCIVTLIVVILLWAWLFPRGLTGIFLWDMQAPYTIFRNNTHTGHAHSSQIKTILLWTPFFSTKDYMASMVAQGCAETRCNVTSDRDLLSQSHAIVFHHRDLDPSDLPATRKSWQRWVYLNHESPPNSPRDSVKTLRDKFNWTITYRLDSDIVLTPLPRLRNAERTPLKKNVAQNKTRMAVWFVSNCHTPGNREAYVAELRKTIPVDIYGECGHKKCTPKMSATCYRDAAVKYRFYLSFENSICKEYVTEKLYHVYDFDIVPVVFGGADYSRVAPPGSYVNAMDFSSPRALGRHLLKVAKEVEAYKKFFDWRNKYEMAIEGYACQLCAKLHDDQEAAKAWTDIEKWWYDDAHCRRWPT